MDEQEVAADEVIRIQNRCRARDSNPDEGDPSAVFKTAASTGSASSAPPAV